jgi:2-oxoglutarate ferredoxin oxidoreductase subunit gamma
MHETQNNFAGKTCQVRIGGVGGQGIVLAGRLLGKAAALFDGKEALCTQSYGPEARGGASRSDVIISNEPIDYPFVTQADILAVLFQEAYTRFRSRVSPDAAVIVDSVLVQPFDDETNVHRLPATQIAEELGSRIVANIVMLGYLAGLTDVVRRESLETAIRSTVRKQHVDLDLRALDAGFARAVTGGAQ